MFLWLCSGVGHGEPHLRQVQVGVAEEEGGKFVGHAGKYRHSAYVIKSAARLSD